MHETEIHKKEIVGRRAFGKDKDIYTEDSDGYRHYKIDIFMDTRSGGLSVDRLGIGQAQKKRIRYLAPLGEKMGENRGKGFRGWAQISVASIHKYVVATKAVGEDNIHHAEIMRDEAFPTVDAKRAFAHLLRDSARRLNFIENPLREVADSRNTQIGNLMYFLKRIWSKYARRKN